MRIETIPVSKINPAKYNPRKDLQPGHPLYEQIKQSIKTFGYIDPIIWNERTGNLIGGHQRFKILAEEGAQFIEASVVSFDPKKEKAANIALNKISGEWDPVKLNELLLDIYTDPIEDLVTGFSDVELKELKDWNADTFAAGPESEQSRLDVKNPVKCPNCGNEFTPA